MKHSLFLFCLLATLTVHAQEDREGLLKQARIWVDTLTSDFMAGRGYVEAGHKKAADFLTKNFQQFGLKPVPGHPFHQGFRIPMNRITDATLSLNGTEVAVGKSFIVYRYSASGSAEGKVVNLKYGLKPKASVRGKIVLIRNGWPPSIANDSDKRAKYKDLARIDQRIAAILPFKPLAVIVIQPKLTMAFAREQLPIPVIEILSSDAPRNIKTARLSVTAKLERVPSQNVIGWIEGTEAADTAIVICGHYDHLGKLSSAIFPGANDNASGTTMLLSMARYFAQHPLKYSIMVIAFGGEETGLVGSRYYVEEEPWVPLDQIKFLLNLDLMGNGIDGIMAVGGKDFPDRHRQLVDLNTEIEAVPKVKSRKNAPNSDHYFFLANGVEGFFIYTLGGPPHYHDVNDTADNLVLSKYVEVRQLLIRFLEKI
ncbi:MAG: M28 family peptidase [Bacteroidota bacterium]